MIKSKYSHRRCESYSIDYDEGGRVPPLSPPPLPTPLLLLLLLLSRPELLLTATSDRFAIAAREALSCCMTA